MTEYKDVYDMLNEIEMDIDSYHIDEVNEFEKQQMLRKFRTSKYENKKRFKGKSHPVRNTFILIAVLAAFSVIQPNITQQIVASVVNILTDVQSSLNQTLFGADKKVDSFFDISEAEMMGDIPIKLEDIYVSENTLSYNLLAYYPEVDGNDMNFGEENVYINGELVELIPSEIMMGFIPDQEGVYQFTHSYYLPAALDLSGDINIALELENLNIHGENNESTSDTVVFKINTTGEELLANINAVETDEEIVTDLHTFTFEEIALSTGYSRILLRANPLSSETLSVNDFSYKFKVTTESGQTVYFTRWNSPGQQDYGSYLLEFRFDEMNSEVSLTELLESNILELQLMRYEGLKSSVDDYEEVGEPVTISLN